jgi:DNA-directed RNA polymerase
MTDLIALQIEHEDNLHGEAVDNAKTRLQQALEGGQLDRVPRARVLMLRLFQQTQEAIQREIDGKAAGPAANLRHILRALPADVSAALALRTGLMMVMRGDRVGVVSVMAAIGSQALKEIEVRTAISLNSAYYDRTLEYLRTSGTVSPRHIAKTMQAVVNAVVPESARMELSQTDLVKFGKFFFDPLIECGLLETVRSSNKGGTVVSVVPSEEARKFLIESEVISLWGGVGTSVCLAPPIPWTSVFEGGYHTERTRKAHLFLRRSKHQTRKARQVQLRAATLDKMPKVFQAANYLQSIQYEIDPAMFATIQTIWHEGGGALGVPTKTFRDKPEFPFQEAWEKAQASPGELEGFNAWKRRVHRWHTASTKHRAAQRDFGALYRVVQKHHGTGIWFPCHVDSRGRFYYWGSPNPQGTDMAKACLRFRTKKALGRRGVFWLKVQIANTYGADTGEFAERAAWTEHRLDDLRRVSAEGADSEFLADADSPLCCLAAIRELLAAIDSGAPESFKSGLIIHMDATCSGLQHFSALLRDPVGGQYVNLVNPGKSKADIYQRVLDLSMARLRAELVAGDADTAAYANLWLSYIEAGKGRKLAKGPCMTLVYGTTFRGIVDHCLDWLEDNGHTVPKGVPALALAGHMTRTLLDAIRETVPAAVAAMEWLQSLVRKVDKDGVIYWETPLGMQVFQQYPVMNDTRVRLRSLATEFAIVKEATDVLDIRKSANGISPNFVHGLDSAHLGGTAIRMEESQCEMSGIHDSAGTHACDVDTMHIHLRAEFFEMYERKCWLTELRDGLGLDTPVPVRGSLDLSKVKSSWAFFC